MPQQIHASGAREGALMREILEVQQALQVCAWTRTCWSAPQIYDSLSNAWAPAWSGREGALVRGMLEFQHALQVLPTLIDILEASTGTAMQAHDSNLARPQPAGVVGPRPFLWTEFVRGRVHTDKYAGKSRVMYVTGSDRHVHRRRCGRQGTQ